MRILVSGSSGMVGTALAVALGREGNSVHRLVRPGTARGKWPEPGEVRWDPQSGAFDLNAATGADAVVHLAGANIGEGRWNHDRKKLLRSSRVDATRHLVASLGKMARKPAMLISASAIGFYGHRGEEMLTEQSAPGDDFLSKLARDWEAEALRAEDHGIRTVVLRFGVILSPAGGALARMLLPFRMGAGGRLGSGRQWMSWVSLPDAVGIIRAMLLHTGLRGVVNAVAPGAVRNADFTKALARVLKRPAILPAPEFALRLALGEMADALLLSSQRVAPVRLMEVGYRFQHAEVEHALRALLAG